MGIEIRNNNRVKKDKRGLIKIRPRTNTKRRELKILYTKPTRKNIRGEDKPWKTINIKRALRDIGEPTKRSKGTHLIWTTDE